MRRRFDYLESELYLRTHTYKSPFLLNPFRATGRSLRWRKAMLAQQRNALWLELLPISGKEFSETS